MSDYYKSEMVPAEIYINPERAEFLPENRHWQGIASIERTNGGRLFSIFYSGGETEGNGNYLAIAMSDDDGSTWKDPVVAIQHGDVENMRVFDPNLWIDPLGRLWITWAQSHGYFDGQDGVWVSVWENPDDPFEKIQLSAPRRIAHGIMMNKPTVLKNGDWLMPCAVWGCMDPSEYHPETENERFSNVYVSRDQGKTFELLGGADVKDRSFDEHMVVEKNDGSLWMLVRCHYGIGQAFSYDGGRTWEGEGDSGIGGPSSRFFITRLKSGNLMMVNHYNFTGRNNLMAKISTDDGKTWCEGLMLDERANVSYPDGKQAEDGRIYIAYDRERYGDREILMAVFTEEDVMAGKCVTEGSRLKVIITKATGRLSYGSTPVTKSYKDKNA